MVSFKKIAVVTAGVCLVGYSDASGHSLRTLGEDIETKTSQEVEKTPDLFEMSPDFFDVASLLPVKIPTVPSLDDPLGILLYPITLIKNSLLSPKADAVAAIVKPSQVDVNAQVFGASGGCAGNIVVEFGTGAASSSNVGKVVPMKKLIAVNPNLLRLCPDYAIPQCKWAYVFPKGVAGTGGQTAEYAVMMYVLTTKAWALFRANVVEESVVAYSYSPDTDKLSPDQCTTYPWPVGAASVFTQGQSVQGITCKVSKFA
eukprot:GHVS01004287.1.p1 GENE.GHVS01004287.1~~GHVS01004287.1.p1  ORF type:complete len:258 (-),score=15.11 GHVS01004287.1:209-982(-)